MKRKYPSPSCSSSSSSSCIESPLINVTEIPLKPESKPEFKLKPKAKPKPKRVRAKKIPNDNSATSAKSRSSIHRGVTRHRWTGRYEAHLWDKTVWNSIQNKRGRQIYLGAYDNEEDAARTYDLAALKYWGTDTTLNFPVEGYTKDLEEMQKLTKEEYLASLRRRSSGFSRGVSKYRGVARHHHNGRWEARIGRVCGNKYLYLGTYGTQEEAAIAYDMAAIEYRGTNAVTNFDISNYADKLNKVTKEAKEEEEEDVQVKQEMKPEVQPHEAHDHHQGEEVQAYEAHDHHHQEDEIKLAAAVKPSVPKLEMTDPIDSEGINVINHPLDDHPWDDDLCIDLNFNIPPFPHLPMDKSSEVFDYQGFEDDIECIFDDNEILQDAVHGNGSGGSKVATSPSSSISVCSEV